MPLLNYTTKIPPHQSIGEIYAVLAAHDAERITTSYKKINGKQRPTGISFGLQTPGGYYEYELPANVAGVLEVMTRQWKEGKVRTRPDYDHAERVAWRILKDWIEAQSAIIEAGMATLHTVMLPYQIEEKSGRPLHELIAERWQALPPGPEKI